MNDDREKLTEANKQLTEANERLIITNKQLESFAASVAHDLRAPLTTITGFTDLTVQHLRRVQTASARMTRLISDLLVFARATDGDLQRSDCDLTAMSTRILDDLQESEPNRNVVVDVTERIIASGDEALLRIALTNLLSNAWKYTRYKEKAHIEVRVTSIEAETVFVIQDDGIGFDMIYHDKVFEPFERLHGQDEYEGNGIGLATVRRIIARHGGWIHAKSSPGQGATFFFTTSPKS